MGKIKLGALVALALIIGLAGEAAALSIDLTLTRVSTIGGTGVYRADLTGIAGLTQIGSVTVTDDGNDGGSGGIFSGYDIDALFLDEDGNLGSDTDQYFATNFLFSAGTTRFTTDPNLLPNTDHPGPVFGSLDANTIDLATATLNDIDAIPVANVNTADGFMSLGDGGVLIANFSPEVIVPTNLFLFLGEVGAGPSQLEGVVSVSTAPVPEPATILLLGAGLAGLVGLRRKASKI